MSPDDTMSPSEQSPAEGTADPPKSRLSLLNPRPHVLRLLSAVDVSVPTASGTGTCRCTTTGSTAAILRSGSLGLGESYMDGWWDCRRLDEA